MRRQTHGGRVACPGNTQSGERRLGVGGPSCPVARARINGARLWYVVEHSVPSSDLSPAQVWKTCLEGGRDRRGLCTSGAALPKARFQVTLVLSPGGPQPDPRSARQAHTAFHTGNSAWSSHVLCCSRRSRAVKSVLSCFQNSL